MSERRDAARGQPGVVPGRVDQAVRRTAGDRTKEGVLRRPDLHRKNADRMQQSRFQAAQRKRVHARSLHPTREKILLQRGDEEVRRNHGRHVSGRRQADG